MYYPIKTNSLPFFVWLYHIRFFQPDVWVHECTPRFPVEIFRQLLEDETEELLNSERSRSILVSAEEAAKAATWAVFSRVFSPTDFGVPTARTRRYSGGLLSLTVEAVHEDEAKFKQLYCLPKEKMKCDLNVYFDFADWQPPSHLGDIDESVSPAESARIEDYQLLAFRNNMVDGSFRIWNKPTALIDIKQSCGFGGIRTKIFPTLLTDSRLYDMICERMVPPQVSWLAQGVPHPDAHSISSNDSVRSLCPWPPGIFGQMPSDDRQDGGAPRKFAVAKRTAKAQRVAQSFLSTQEQRLLTGNSMHWCQIGTRLGHLLLCAQVKWPNVSSWPTQ